VYAAAATTIQFRVTADAGVRILLGGVQVLSQWSCCLNGVTSTNAAIGVGYTSLVIRFWGGAATNLNVTFRLGGVGSFQASGVGVFFSSTQQWYDCGFFFLCFPHPVVILQLRVSLPASSTPCARCRSTAGSYCPSGTSPATQIPCVSGDYCATGAAAAAACWLGNFCPTPSLMNRCPAGEFCNTTRLTRSHSCQPGYYTPTTGRTAQVASPTGSFVPTSGQSLLTACTFLTLDCFRRF
jgi:hypothetical protein